MKIRVLAIITAPAIVGGLAFPAPPSAVADQNIYAPDVKSAQRGVDRAQNRLAAASADVLEAEQALPAAEGAAAQLGARARVAERRSDRALERVESREDAIEDRRAAALDEVEDAQAALSARTADWRGERAFWISAAALLLGFGAAVGVLAFTAARPRDPKRVGGSAARSALALGAAVAVCLCALIGVLWWADAWVFSWWPIAAATLALAAAVVGAAFGWVRGPGLRRPVLLRFVAVAALLACVAVVPSALAASSEPPRGKRLGERTLRLAQLADTDASMPPDVRAARRSAEELEDAAQQVARRHEQATSYVSSLEQLRSSGLARQRKAERSLTIWAERLTSAQADYDEYQQLLEPLDEGYDDYDPPDLGAPGDLPDLPELPDLPDLPDSGYPTTEDFGEGLGSIGLCNDGTLSDSIGRPGACSHHGGVR